jgi:hypothetical protein
MLSIPMPVFFLNLIFPPLRSFRHFGRWGLAASLVLAVLAGLGFTKLAIHLGPRRQAVLGLGCLLLLMLEFNTQPLPAVTSVEQMRRDVDSWLASQREQSVIIEYPLSYTTSGQTLYYTIAHKQRIVHGYGGVLPPGYHAMRTTLDQWPAAPALDLLERIGVRYVLVHSFQGDDFENKSLPDLLKNQRLRFVARFATPIGCVRAIYLFELVDQQGIQDSSVMEYPNRGMVKRTESEF